MSSTRTVWFPELASGSFGVGESGNSRTWALDVADDGAGLVVHELYADLGDTTTRTCRFPAGLAGRPAGGRAPKSARGAYRYGPERG